MPANSTMLFTQGELFDRDVGFLQIVNVVVEILDGFTVGDNLSPIPVELAFKLVDLVFKPVEALIEFAKLGVDEAKTKLVVF